MMFKPVILTTDWVLYGLLAAMLFYIVHVLRSEELRARWRHVFRSPAALGACTILVVFLTIAIADSIHFRPAIDTSGENVIYDVKTVSLLDKALGKA
ncbi:MAG: ABC transporter permease, partial [Burkholderiales bacterium]|nr:ABC transporter permease [Burkholderiales bacterium]